MDRVFFGQRTLRDLPDEPVLIVNATDFERPAREVFYKRRAQALCGSRGEAIDQAVRVAEVVAASGAFPGAFQPKSIAWATAAERFGGEAEERRFADGGVIENLGVEGRPPKPAILIISDASAGTGEKGLGPKVGLFTRLYGISYDALNPIGSGNPCNGISRPCRERFLRQR